MCQSKKLSTMFWKDWTRFSVPVSYFRSALLIRRKTVCACSEQTICWKRLAAWGLCMFRHYPYSNRDCGRHLFKDSNVVSKRHICRLLRCNPFVRRRTHPHQLRRRWRHSADAKEGDNPGSVSVFCGVVLAVWCPGYLRLRFKSVNFTP
jgi:hypothetical protein